MFTQLKIIKALEDDTDYKQKQLKINEVDLIDTEVLRHNLKDREHGNDYINDFEEGRKKMEQYIKALDREITKRRQVIKSQTITFTLVRQIAQFRPIKFFNCYLLMLENQFYMNIGC